MAREGLWWKYENNRLSLEEERDSDGNSEVGNITENIGLGVEMVLSGRVTEIERQMVHVLRIEKAEMSRLQH